MKVTLLMPDPVFAEAEELAKPLNTSRSDLYARALHALVGAHAPDRVTKAINEVDEVGSGTNPFVQEAARQVSKRI